MWVSTDRDHAPARPTTCDAVPLRINKAGSVVDSAFDPVRNAAEGITGYGALKDENAQLQRELDELRGRLQRRRAVGSEVGELE